MRVKIQGFLKNWSENSIHKIEGSAIQTKNTITYMDQDIKHIVKWIDNKICFIRENQEFKNTLLFDLKETTENEYYLKDNNQFFIIQIKTHFLSYKENKIELIYEVLDSHEKFEYNIEIR